MLRGELVEWNEPRGFGFILGDDGKRYFVHISNIGRIANRPRQGDLVRFSVQTGRDGRLQARSVAIQGANPKATAAQWRRGTEPASAPSWRLLVAAVLSLLIVVGLLLGRIPWLVVALYAVMGLVSCFAYGADKRFAEQKRWRISEATLLGVDLCFGIVGGLIGQALFRHKTRKQPYVATTLLIAGVHMLWLGGFAFGFIGPDALANVLPQLTNAFSSKPLFHVNP